MPLVVVSLIVDGHLSSFPTGTITSDAGVNILAHTFCANVQILFGRYMSLWRG